MKMLRVFGYVSLVAAGLGGSAVRQAAAQYGMPNHPSVTVEGQSWTPLSIVSRNMGSKEDQEGQFPPHRIIGNIYYVGTKTLSSFLIVTPDGNILIDSTYERNVPVILKSVEQLGFKFSDTKILLGNHAHGDHMEGDALVKMLTGAKVEVMAEDVPALMAMKPGGKEHPLDVTLHDGDTISLGGVVLTAHLVAGHTRGCTAFTTVVKEKGKDYNVVFGCSLRSPTVITPAVAAEFTKTFAVVKALPCDVQLGDHPSQYGMIEKYEKLKASGGKGLNPFIDKATCKKETEIEEAMFHAIMEEQEKAGK